MASATVLVIWLTTGGPLQHQRTSLHVWMNVFAIFAWMDTEGHFPKENIQRTTDILINGSH